MKSRFYILGLLLLFVSSISFISCETDIDVTSEWKDITIVYGLLSQNDSIHYLKINKAFLGDGNSLEYAKEPDSLNYFGNLDVTLTEVNEYGGTRTFQFDTVTVAKEEGVFATRQLVYKSDFRMPADLIDANSGNDKNYTYNLLIKNKTTGKEIKSSTTLVKDFSFITPRSGQPTIEFLSDKAVVKWESAKNARRYDVYIRFWFQEISQANDTTDRYVDWTLGNVKSNTLNGGEDLSIPYLPTSFYDICNSLIPYKDAAAESNIIARLTNKVVYTIVASGDELNTYLDINGPSSGLIQDRPEYTNIDNGLGLFSARFTKRNSIMVGSLTEGQFIALRPNLKFINKIGN
ncbi:MAG TPA: hypothetical protein VK172_04505 [Lentimicrobium sp.]|nr:hypothetical protein [Lentimicrobium sp.]